MSEKHNQSSMSPEDRLAVISELGSIGGLKMIEIKFRLVFKCKKTGQISFQIHTLDDLINNKHNFYERFFDVTKDRYTGRKDADGKEVYERDILKVPHEIYRMGRETDWQGTGDGMELVCWDNELSAFMLKDLDFLKNGWTLGHIMGRYLWVMKGTEGRKIVANVHENPELLKGAA